MKVSLGQLLVSLKVFTRDGRVGWDGSRVGPVGKDLKSEFMAVLVSMLSMLVQVRSKKGGGRERGLVLINASTLFLVQDIQLQGFLFF